MNLELEKYEITETNYRDSHHIFDDLGLTPK
jgi:hypothetical protein